MKQGTGAAGIVGLYNRKEAAGRKITFRAEEIFYYLFFAILLFAKGIGLYDGMRVFTLCLLAAFLCFAIKICLTEHTLGELIMMAFLLGVGFLSYRTSGEKAAFVYVAVIVGMKHVPVKRVFRVGAVIWTAAFFGTILLALLKKIPDLALVHSKLGLGHIIRWSLGYTHPNVLHVSYVILLAFLFYLARFDKKRLLIFTGAAYLFNFYIFLYSISYTGLILTTVYLLLNLYFNLRKKETAAEKALILSVFPICTALSVIGPVVVKGPMFDILNKLMNTRWNLSRYFLTEQPIGLFGSRFTDLPDTSYSIDCSYVYVLMYYGVLLFILMCIACFQTVRYEVKLGRGRELAIMLSFFIAGMSEPFMANLSFKNLTLLFIGEYYYQAPFWNKGLLGRICGRKIRLTPWAEKELCITVPRRAEKRGLAERLKGNGWRIILAGILVGVLAGGICYTVTEPMDCVYVDVGLSDYWTGERIRPVAADLPDDWNGIIIGSADGETDMYVLTGNIVWLEQIRCSVSVGLWMGVLAAAASGIWFLRRKAGKSKKGRGCYENSDGK